MPGDYTLLPVQESQRPGKRAERKSLAPKKKKNSKAPKRSKVHFTTGVRERMGGYDL